MPYDDEDIPEEYREAYDAAVALSESPELARAFGELAREPDRFAEYGERGGDALREHGVDVPDTLAVSLFGGKPDPGTWQAFRLTLTRCRTIKKLDRSVEPPVIREATVCLGIAITPNPVPGGPKG